jgi:hypothetical protein
MMPSFINDLDAVLDYSIESSKWLAGDRWRLSLRSICLSFLHSNCSTWDVRQTRYA